MTAPLLARLPTSARLLIVMLALCLSGPLRAAPTIELTPKHAIRIGLNEGLSQSTVSAILQARDGRIWLATGDGITLFDGTRFSYLFRQRGNLRGLQSNATRALFQDASGAIWVGTLGGGLSKFAETGEHLANYRVEAASLPSNDVFAIAQSPDGAIWVGTSAGLARLNPNETSFVRIYSLPHLPVKALFALPDGTMLIGSSGAGLYRLNPETREIDQFTAKTSPLPGDTITALTQDRSGQIWIGTEEGGVARYTPLTQTIDTPLALPEPDIEAIAEGFDGRIWFGGWSSGIYVWDPITDTLKNFRASPALHQRLSSNTILALAPDRTGRMWVGTYDSGAASVSQFPDTFTSFEADPSGLAGPRYGVIWALAPGGPDTLWIGTKEGLSRLDRKTNRFTEITLGEEGPTAVQAILPDAGGLLLATRPQGLLRYDPARKRATPVTAPGARTPLFANSFIRLLMRDSQGRLWVGTRSGLILLAPDNSEIARFSANRAKGDLPSPLVRALFEAPDGTIWVGTNAGLSRFLPDSMRFQTLSGHDVLPDNDVRAILSLAPETLLVATSGGLAQIDLATQSSRFLLRDHGLPNETLHALLPDGNGDIWIPTNNGLARYSPATGAIAAFHTRDGLPGNEFNANAAARLSDGTLAVGGVEGLAVFNPSRLSPNTFPPLVTVHTNARPQTGLQNLLDVTIGLSHYDDPAQNALRWRLDPADRSWSETRGPTHHIRRENLPAGDYTLRYIAMSAGGVAAPEAQLPFSVPLSPFKRWYALLAYGTLTALALWALASARLARISRRNHELGDLVATQTRDLAEANARLQDAAAERAQFYARAAHDIRTPLSLIKAPLQKILASPTLAINERRLVQMVDRAAQRMVHLIDEMASIAQDRAAPPGGQFTVEIERFLAPILALYRDAAIANTQLLSISHTGPSSATLDTNALETILHNLLSNAVRHAPKGTQISLSTRLDKSLLTLRIVNAGPALPAASVALMQGYATRTDLPPATKGLALIGAATLRADGALTIDPAHPDITITLPADGHAEDPAPLSRAARILIVEDNAELRDYLTTLTSAVAVPTAVGSLAAARRAVLRGNFEVILCDVLLPDGSGFDFAQSVKTDAETSHIGLVFLTALTDAASYREGLSAWADDYVTKPFDAEELLTKLRILLRARDRLRAHLNGRIAANTGAELAAEIEIAPIDHRFLTAFQAYLDSHAASPEASLAEAARHCAMSKRALQRKLDMLFAKSFSILLKEARMVRASALLRSGVSVTDTAERCGYATLPSFSRQFKEHFGQAPRDFLKTARAEQSPL